MSVHLHSASAANAEAERKMSKYQKLEKIGEGTYGQPLDTPPSHTHPRHMRRLR